MGSRSNDRQPDNLAGQLYDEADAETGARADEWRRSSPRRTSDAPLEVRANGRILTAVAVNVGPDSLCVRVREGVREGDAIRVRRAYEDGAPWYGAEVVHCTETLGGYKLGLRVESGALPD